MDEFNFLKNKYFVFKVCKKESSIIKKLFWKLTIIESFINRVNINKGVKFFNLISLINSICGKIIIFDGFNNKMFLLLNPGIEENKIRWD